MAMSKEYVNIEAIHPDYREETCWNCGNTKHVKRRWTVCKECFMGQKQHNSDASATTPEGYTDYRLLWYGDVSIEEAKRLHEKTQEEVRESMGHPGERKREVRI